jgi:thymidine kinase
MNQGRIELIIGCMFSGKSTETIRLCKRFNSIKKKCLVIKHNSDTRYDDGNKLSTHDESQIECISSDSLLCFLDTKSFNESNIIIIEEAQFFNDLFEFTTKSADIYNKTLIVTGLDGDFKRNMFGDVLRLIPHAEKITRLNAYCSICNDGTKAYFTKRIVEDKNVNVVGNQNKYKAVCRYHYNN